MSRALLPAERGPRMIFGKLYHWRILQGNLSLGRCPGAHCATCEFQQ